MNYFDRIPHFALFLGFRYAKCGKHGLLPGDDMADRGLKPWPDGETKNPEINAWKKPQKTSKVAKKKKKKKLFEIIAKSWQISNAKMSKMSKNLKKCWTIWKLDNLAKSWQNSIWKLEKCPKIWKNDEKLENCKILLNIDKIQFESWKKCPKF